MRLSHILEGSNNSGWLGSAVLYDMSHEDMLSEKSAQIDVNSLYMYNTVSTTVESTTSSTIWHHSAALDDYVNTLMVPMVGMIYVVHELTLTVNACTTHAHIPPCAHPVHARCVKSARLSAFLLPQTKNY